MKFPGEADPEIQPERLRELRAPIAPQRNASVQAADDLVGEKPERARTVARASDRFLERNLFLDRADDLRMVKDREIGPVQGTQARAVGKNLPDGDAGFSSAAEPWPEFRYPRIQPEPSGIERVKRAGGGHALGGRPDQHQRVLPPGNLPCGIAEPAAEREDFPPILPDREGGTGFAALRKIGFESRSDAGDARRGHGIHFNVTLRGKQGAFE